MLMLGLELRLPLTLLRGTLPENDMTDCTVSEYVSKLRAKLSNVHDVVRDTLIIKSDKMKTNYD